MSNDSLLEWLKTIDEVLLCELLDISTEDIIDRFGDIIHSRRSLLESEMEVLDSSLTDEELNFDDDV